MDYSNTKISNWTLERYLLGELPSEKIEFIDKAVAQDRELSLRIENLKKDNETILTLFPAEKMALRINESLESRGTRWQRPKPLLLRWAPVAVPAFACVLVFVIFQSQQTQVLTPPIAGPEITRVKGLTSKILLYKKTDRGTEVLHEGSVAKNGDTIQISYIASTMKYGMIFSVDGQSMVTLHFPSELESPALLKPKGETTLPFSYQLDDAPDYETFFFVTSNDPIAVKEMLGKIRINAKANVDSLPTLFPAPRYKTSFAKIKKE